MKTRIKELRAKYNLTQEQLANKIGVRRETILFIESGKYNPSLKLAFQISRVLKSNVNEVFFFSEKELKK
ncbi:MAG: helix-turn-helix transcriptional regulator [Candidatus Nanoarchaeia archaeon]|jgi:putative transcriptional regulator|nr:helix-turn-helix transcriptional regulator [Candidatus Nanoarchaeia archaeon]MDD3993583.1 helix-turn-helix transcriptional regulator [Candidatus Nanoarchaeia archaeon]MDD4563795.1 helix-turn-helix transcriptional regulator [Candidatus Nanoarchaeia archaeon]